LFAGADSTHVLDLVIRNTERMVVLPTPPLYMECSERELSFAILDVAAALSRPDLAIAMRPLIFWYGKRPATVLVYPISAASNGSQAKTPMRFRARSLESVSQFRRALDRCRSF
jgi:hypothetical protein